MKVHKGYKFRLEPTEEQKVKINKTLGCCRFVYNSMLDRRIKAYQRRGESMSYIDTQNLLPQMKTYLPWLAEVDSQALKYSCRQLNNAYKGFFEDGKGSYLQGNNPSYSKRKILCKHSLRSRSSTASC